MSNPADRRPPAPQTSTDRPTATHPTGQWLARLEHEEAAHRERLADLWADATPTEELPLWRSARPAAPFVRTNGGPGPAPSQHEQAPQPAPHVTTNDQPIQDMWRPGLLARPSMRWHPSLMQLAIGAALVAALLGACNVAAINAHRTARNHCHALVSSDWDRAQRECRGTGSGTPRPEQIPSSPHTPSPAPSGGPSPSTPPAFTRVNSPSPSTQPSSSPQGASSWVTSDTHSPYDRTDPSASPLALPRCTTAQDTPMPCLASLSADGSRAVVLEEDASLTGLVRR